MSCAGATPCEVSIDGVPEALVTLSTRSSLLGQHFAHRNGHRRLNRRSNKFARVVIGAEPSDLTGEKIDVEMFGLNNRTGWGGEMNQRHSAGPIQCRIESLDFDVLKEWRRSLSNCNGFGAARWSSEPRLHERTLEREACVQHHSQRVGYRLGTLLAEGCVITINYREGI
jgi:hypothetical protein